MPGSILSDAEGPAVPRGGRRWRSLGVTMWMLALRAVSEVWAFGLHDDLVGFHDARCELEVERDRTLTLIVTLRARRTYPTAPATIS